MDAYRYYNKTSGSVLIWASAAPGSLEQCGSAGTGCEAGRFGQTRRPCFGLRFRRNSQIIQLLQIGGSGRLKLGAHDKVWWEKPPSVCWEVYEAVDGRTYSTREEAEAVAANLSRYAS